MLASGTGVEMPVDVPRPILQELLDPHDIHRVNYFGTICPPQDYVISSGGLCS